MKCEISFTFFFFPSLSKARRASFVTPICKLEFTFSEEIFLLSLCSDKHSNAYRYISIAENISGENVTPVSRFGIKKGKLCHSNL